MEGLGFRGFGFRGLGFGAFCILGFMLSPGGT